MTRFIFFCMAFVAFSFLAVPIFYDVAEERDALIAANTAPSEDNLQTATIAAGNEVSADDLNAIAPAAAPLPTGEDAGFNAALQPRNDSAL